MMPIQQEPPQQRYVRARLPAAQNRAKRNHHNLVQIMPFLIPCPRILKLLQ
jgi:hypothetical protein